MGTELKVFGCSGSPLGAEFNALAVHDNGCLHAPASVLQ